ncbi:FAD-binding oxidoreductase [Microbacterium sp. ARD32]|uniref:FAD-binding oxidoreductase n=1 Tax=Microbacterium sp. ARD32 TaxID=2962577 RepID=UPI002881AA73|nr:FAD-binding oxidoreductase [Microbacterium sp. ARD32]MDT0158693.1 FAD-binding oxidoreductase [Microbacterium sp. ARD32]
MTEQLIITPSSVDDVVEAIGRAGRDGLGITVVAGGHGLWSHRPDDGMRIELSAMSDIRIDGTTVSVGGGATWGAVAERLGREGLAISSGDTASVGVGGLTLGGGIGWMTRLRGLAADQLIGAQVVTADGEVVETSATQHPDLFWALRGGGGNFGVVTRFDFAAHRLPSIVHAEYTGAVEPAALLRAMRDAMRDAPRELTVTYMDVPPMDPSAPAGASLVAVWAGDDEHRLREALAAVHDVEGVTARITTPAYRDILAEMPPADPDQQSPGFVGGNGLFAQLDDELIDRLVAFRAAHPSSVVFMRSLGGAFGAVPQESTAFPGRDATWFIMAGGFDVPGLLDDAGRDAIAADWAAMQEGSLAEYGNFVSVDEPQRVPGMFTSAAHARLREVKARWDPRNLFRRNHNIV